MPNLTAFYVGPNRDFTGMATPCTGTCPLTLINHFKYLFRFSRGEPLDRRRHIYFYETENYRPVANRTNRYRKDRDAMRA